ncbi:MAG: Rqc2 family fibronectin-binding protein [Christensenellaceae bacterium]
MTLDGLTLNICIKELQTLLTGAKIQKVLMPEKEEVVLLLYTAEGTRRLALSADAAGCAVYLTSRQKENPKTPGTFCMFLRKHLTGARIKAISQHGFDRVVMLDLDSKDELLHPIVLTLVIEVMGKYSNIILTDENRKILDSLKRVSVDVSSLRQILPGARYEDPPQQKYDPLATSQVTAAELIQTQKQVRIANHLVSVFDGISMQTAAEILFRADIHQEFTTELTTKLAERIANVMHGFFREATESPQPSLQKNADGLPVFFSAVPYETYPRETRMEFGSANEMLDYYYGRRLELFRLKQQKEAYTKTVNQALIKLNKKIHIYENSLSDAQKSEKIRQRAEQITANLYRLEKGMPSFEGIDYETGEPIEILLDLSMTPGDLAQKLYKKIAKLKTAANMNMEKLQKALEEQQFLLNTLHFIDQAESAGDIRDIRATLEKTGYMKTPSKSKKEPEPEFEPLKYDAPGGYTVLVGRNDRQNDILTMRTAAKDDIWFHAQKIPGSHVLLQTNGTPLDDIADEAVVFAAQLAARHSRAKQSGKTPVDYALRKNIKKPPGAKPGMVIYDDYYTVYVDAASSAENA